MNYLLALIIGAWVTQCLYAAHREHRDAGLARWEYFVLCVLISLAWPIILGVAIRSLFLGKPKIPRPKLDA